jgi:hypothetical protein
MDFKSKKKSSSLVQNESINKFNSLVLGLSVTLFSEMVTYPLEFLKVKSQLNGAINSAHNFNMLG